MAINATTLENALQAAVVTCSGIPTARVIWANQDIPAPSAPWATIAITSISGVGLDAERATTTSPPVVGSEVTLAVEGDRDLAIAISFYGGTATEATAPQWIAQTAKTKLGRADVRDALLAAGLGLYDTGTITPLPAVTRTGFEARAVLEIRGYARERLTTTTTSIERVETTDTITGAVIVAPPA